MKHSIAIAILYTIALSITALAQGSGSSGVPRVGGIERSFAVTRTLTGVIVEIKAEQKILVVEDTKGKRYDIKLDDKTKFKGDDKTKNEDRQSSGKMTLSDLQAGQTVRVTYRESDGKATQVQLRTTKLKSFPRL